MSRNNYPFHLVEKTREPVYHNETVHSPEWQSLNNLTLSMHKAARKRAAKRRMWKVLGLSLFFLAALAVMAFGYYQITP